MEFIAIIKKGVIIVLGFLLVIILLAIVSLIMTLDVTKKISVTGKMVMWIYLIIAPHILLVLYFFRDSREIFSNGYNMCTDVIYLD